MTAKEYLSQAYRLDEQINCKIQQLSTLNDLATKATSTLTGMPHNPNKATSTLENAITKIIDLQHEINADIDRLVDLKAEITKVISSVEDVDQRYILEKRYLCWTPWPEIAVELNISNRWLYRLHDMALENVQKIISPVQ